MPVLNDRGDVVDNPWVLLRDAKVQQDVLQDNTSDVIFPLQYWLANAAGLRARAGRCAVWLNSDEEPDALAPTISVLPLIAVNFPAFNDGRGLSSAVLLRTRLHFGGELRAIGDVRQDQLSYMRRCGFNTFHAVDDAAVADLRNGLFVMHDYYQGSVADPNPLFRRRDRPAAGGSPE